jgi:hypothetical protein
MGAVPDIEETLRKLALKLGERAKIEVLPQIPSEALRNGLRLLQRHSSTGAELFIPHYWAIYVHDDRQPFGPRRAKVLVWFADPKDDPRRPNDVVRFSDWRSLKRQEFLDGIQRNIQRKSVGLPAFMFVRKFQPHAREGAEFFSKGLGSFERSPQTDDLVFKMVDGYARKVGKAISSPKPKPIRAKIRTR